MDILGASTAFSFLATIDAAITASFGADEYHFR
jgi:hypothetical protein